MTEIPIVDISAAVNGDDVGELVATLRGVMEDVGFLQITGHGIPQSMIDAVHDTMQAMDGFSARGTRPGRAPPRWVAGDLRAVRRRRDPAPVGVPVHPLRRRRRRRAWPGPSVATATISPRTCGPTAVPR